MELWKSILDQLKAGKKLVLMYVLFSEGSSPGRQGFKMMVADDGYLEGSIGGGIMEHKLVELSKTHLKKGPFPPFIKKQIHQSNIGENRSGMICSGEQIVAFYYLDVGYIPLFELLIQHTREKHHCLLQLNQEGLSFHNDLHQNTKFGLQIKNEEEWIIKENPLFEPSLFIIGGGHVGLALSEVMARLGFHITVFDDRKDLNTFHQNTFAHKKEIVDYKEISQHIPEGEATYIALMTFGYRTDALCIKQLLGRNYKYFGVLGSKEKMHTLFEDLIREGYDKKEIEKLHSPIGIQINSKTPLEIAVSIAAEIIAMKNTN